MKPVKKAQPDRLTHERHQQASNDPEEGVFVVPLVIDLLTAWNFSHTARRILVLVPLGISTLALVAGVALFILTLPTDTHATNLLRSGALLWSFNILIFALC